MLVERGEVFERAPSTGGANSNSLAHKVSPTLGTTAGLTGLPTTTPSLVHLVEENVFTQFSDEVRKEGRRWVLDSGASNHMTGVREVFVELNRNICGTVRFGDGSVVEIEGIETVLFGCKNGEHRSLSGVYLIPKLTTNIISLGLLDEVGYKVVINGGVMRVWDEQQRLLMKVLRSSNRLYVQSMEMAQPVSLVMKGAEGAWLWHARYGHLNFWALKLLAREELVGGMPKIEHIEQLCTGCLVGKQRRAQFPRKSEYRVEDVLELVHGDICGPTSLSTPSGNRYFILLVDDASRFMWIKVLAIKDAAFATIKKYQAAAEAETGRKLRVFRSDRGGEFNSGEFAKHCAEHGVRRQLTTPYTPQQNNVVERRN
jgi:hypothetical protein